MTRCMIRMVSTLPRDAELVSCGFTNTREGNVNPRNKPVKTIFYATNYLVKKVYRKVQKGNEYIFRSIRTSCKNTEKRTK